MQKQKRCVVSAFVAFAAGAMLLVATQQYKEQQGRAPLLPILTNAVDEPLSESHRWLSLPDPQTIAYRPEAYRPEAGAPKISCAFVSNNPHLSKSYGHEIDQHDRVIRFNNFWHKKCVLDCNEMWGAKTTDIVLNNHREVSNRPAEWAQPPWQRCYRRRPYPAPKAKKMKKKFYKKYLTEKESVKLDPNCEVLTKGEWESLSRLIRSAGKKMHVKVRTTPSHGHMAPVPTTGFMGVMKIAPQCTDMSYYGFSSPSQSSFYHGWSGHSYDVEHALIKELFPDAQHFF